MSSEYFRAQARDVMERAGGDPANAGDIEVGDGDTFDRIESIATAALVALNQTTLDAEGQPITVDHVRVQWNDKDETITVAASEDSEPYDAAVHELVGDDRRIIWAQGL
jgi:ligand-binding sensor domain-containing protein